MPDTTKPVDGTQLENNAQIPECTLVSSIVSLINDDTQSTAVEASTTHSTASASSNDDINDYFNASFNGIQSRNKHEKRTRKEIKSKCSAVVCVSIAGNENYKGNRLLSILESSHRVFHSVIYLIGDIQHAINLAPVFPEERHTENVYLEQALAMGDEYLEKALPIFLAFLHQLNKNFDIPAFYLRNKDKSITEKIKDLNEQSRKLKAGFKIERQQEWQESVPDLVHKVPLLIEKLKLNPRLENIKKKVATSYVDRHWDKQNNPFRSAEIQRSENYHGMEIPWISCVAAARGINYVAYAGRQLNNLCKPYREHCFTNKLTGKDDLRVLVSNPDKLALGIQIKINKKNPSANINHSQNRSSSGFSIRSFMARIFGMFTYSNDKKPANHETPEKNASYQEKTRSSYVSMMFGQAAFTQKAVKPTVTVPASRIENTLQKLDNELSLLPKNEARLYLSQVNDMIERQLDRESPAPKIFS